MQQVTCDPFYILGIANMQKVVFSHKRGKLSG